MRAARVSGFFAVAIHSRMPRFAEGGNASHGVAAGGCAASAAASSSGTCSASTASSFDHEPSAFAASTFARPAAVMRPEAIMRSTRSLFGADHPVRGPRGANHGSERSASSALTLLSTQPKHSASSTDAS